MGQPVTRWSAQGDRVSFSRADKGFIAINANGDSWSAAVATDLPDGTYCDVIQGLSKCIPVTVASGQVKFTVAANAAVAIHVGAKAGSDGGDENNDSKEPTAVCDASKENRIECGYSGVDQVECEGNGCCWSPLEDGSKEPWCFTPGGRTGSVEDTTDTMGKTTTMDGATYFVYVVGVVALISFGLAVLGCFVRCCLRTQNEKSSDSMHTSLNDANYI